MQSKANLLIPVVVKESTVFICRMRSKDNKQLMLKRPKLPEDFWASVSKDNIRSEGLRVNYQFMDILLISWWRGDRMIFWEP